MIQPKISKIHHVRTFASNLRFRIWTHISGDSPYQLVSTKKIWKKTWKSTISPRPNPTCKPQVAPAGFPQPGRISRYRAACHVIPSPLAGRSTWGSLPRVASCWGKKIFQDCYGWWFRNLANLLRLVVYPIIYGVLWPSKRWLALGFLNHQQ